MANHTTNQRLLDQVRDTQPLKPCNHCTGNTCLRYQSVEIRRDNILSEGKLQST